MSSDDGSPKAKPPVPRGGGGRTLSALLVAITATIGAGCSSVPIPPTYTRDELRAICQRQMGWWHPNGVREGYCEYDSHL